MIGLCQVRRVLRRAPGQSSNLDCLARLTSIRTWRNARRGTCAELPLVSPPPEISVLRPSGVPAVALAIAAEHDLDRCKHLNVLGGGDVPCAKSQCNGIQLRAGKQSARLADVGPAIRRAFECAESEQTLLPAWRQRLITRARIVAWTDGSICRTWGPRAAPPIAQEVLDEMREIRWDLIAEDWSW